MQKFPCFLFILFSAYPGLAQKKQSHKYQPRYMQVSPKIGIVHTSVGVQYNIAPKAMIDIDAGIGMVYLQSNYYNRYNKNTEKRDDYFSNGLNLGRAWWTVYSSVKLKRIFDVRSKREYTSGYVNTFNYYGIMGKFNSPEVFATGADKNQQFNETWQFMGILGRQVELSKYGYLTMDIYLGAGPIINYQFNELNAKVTLGANFGLNFLNRNQKQ